MGRCHSPKRGKSEPIVANRCPARVGAATTGREAPWANLGPDPLWILDFTANIGSGWRMRFVFSLRFVSRVAFVAAGAPDPPTATQRNENETARAVTPPERSARTSRAPPPPAPPSRGTPPCPPPARSPPPPATGRRSPA